VIDPGRVPARCCDGRLARTVDSVLSGINQSGVSVENEDCAGIPVRLVQDGGSMD